MLGGGGAFVSLAAGDDADGPQLRLEVAGGADAARGCGVGWWGFVGGSW